MALAEERVQLSLKGAENPRLEITCVFFYYVERNNWHYVLTCTVERENTSIGSSDEQNSKPQLRIYVYKGLWMTKCSYEKDLKVMAAICWFESCQKLNKTINLQTLKVWLTLTFHFCPEYLSYKSNSCKLYSLFIIFPYYFNTQRINAIN